MSETVTLEDVKLSALQPAEYNPRQISEQQMAALSASLGRWGLADPLIVDLKHGMVVIGGHQRIRDLQAQGVEDMLMLRRGDIGWVFTKEELVLQGPDDAKALNVALNNIMGNFEVPKLQAVLRDLDELDDGGELLKLTGFDEDALSKLLTDMAREGAEDGFDIDAELDAIEEPTTQPGDMWELGAHRLLCGDCTKEEDMARLMGDDKAALVLTSPPYFVGKEYEEGRTFEEHLQLLEGFITQSVAVMDEGGYLFVNFGDITAKAHTKRINGVDDFHIYHIAGDYYRLLEAAGLHFYAARIWYKPFERLMQPFWSYHTTLPHHQEWEYLWTWRKPSAKKEKCRDWDTSVHAVWDTRHETTEDRPLTRHVAAFPLCLPLRGVTVYTDRGDIVVDPFGGSGSTMMACEQLGRSCRSIEIEPRYVDLAVKRWEQKTGEQARRLEG